MRVPGLLYWFVAGHLVGSTINQIINDAPITATLPALLAVAMFACGIRQIVREAR